MENDPPAPPNELYRDVSGSRHNFLSSSVMTFDDTTAVPLKRQESLNSEAWGQGGRLVWLLRRESRSHCVVMTYRHQNSTPHPTSYTLISHEYSVYKVVMTRLGNNVVFELGAQRVVEIVEISIPAHKCRDSRTRSISPVMEPEINCLEV